MVGVFGVLAYGVQQRQRDFGVRMALGAAPRDVLHLVVGSAARLLGFGALIGLGLALPFGQLLGSVLFGVRPLDPLTLVGVTLLIVVAALVALAAPAWRAARVDPVVALRNGRHDRPSFAMRSRRACRREVEQAHVLLA
jgi:ABC-type antimicrobial peptide transport system permease subunit